MKTLAAFLTLICLSTFTVMGQQKSFDLSVKEESLAPTSKTEHFYLLQIKNNSRSVATVELNGNNILCSDKDSKGQVNLNREFLNASKTTQISTIKLNPNETKEFYIKIYRPQNTKLNTWNCTEIVALSTSDNKTSNAIIIKTFIPDPKDFN